MKKVMITLFGFAALMLGTAPAHADLDRYLQLLDSANVQYHDPQSAATMGRAVCNSVDEFANPTQIEGAIEAAMYTEQAAKDIAHASIKGLCPQDAPNLEFLDSDLPGRQPTAPDGRWRRGCCPPAAAGRRSGGVTTLIIVSHYVLGPYRANRRDRLHAPGSNRGPRRA